MGPLLHSAVSETRCQGEAPCCVLAVSGTKCQGLTACCQLETGLLVLLTGCDANLSGGDCTACCQQQSELLVLHGPPFLQPERHRGSSLSAAEGTLKVHQGAPGRHRCWHSCCPRWHCPGQLPQPLRQGPQTLHMTCTIRGTPHHLCCSSAITHWVLNDCETKSRSVM